MKFGLRAKLTLVFGFLTLIGISNSGLLWLAEKNAADQQSQVQHTHTVITRSQALLGHLRDAETGQRGFLLTNQDEYLEPYAHGMENSLEDHSTRLFS